MTFEIERKFLVKSTDFKKDYLKKTYIKQGFLNSDKNRVVRVRITDNKGFLTVKGLSNESGTTRFEWEKEIDRKDAVNLLTICEDGIIEKYRYVINFSDSVYEVDEFLGDNGGLFIAEIELKSENEPFSKPTWLGKEVTGIKKYYNAKLIKNPYKNWKK
ncbi:MAG: CYTH domain-containing protein [Flavobacteriaceae bacterium]|jgi:CYTH domain-containing protein|nr:CYTH domain-containing protein [Flavobacteriaceae bacterium]